ncbi:MAG: bifunctional hydroxymethylpyrimidine kinase/phosphomethylpyrimidine kinase [Clostridium sp.]|nr:bifunctional hydroxymethylpyrimidine kinase/phosphomethylpyrimidine kinase [Clostridium sp.]
MFDTKNFDFDKEKLENYINKLNTPKVLIIGDMGIDEMVYGDTERISREAPVLILKHSNTKIILGQAANAAHNLATINEGKVSAIGLYGNDYYGPMLLDAFKKAGINTEYMVQDSSRPTTVKSRISGASFHSVTQQIVRIDRLEVAPPSKEIENKIIENIEKAIPLHDAVILSDYNIGLLTDRIIETTINAAKKSGKIVVVDAQKDLYRFKGAYALTPNQPDSEKAVGYFIKDSGSLDKAGSDILKMTEANVLLLTRGGDGMAVFDSTSERHIDVPVFNKTNVFDVTGAGDTVVASFTLALAAGAEPKYAAIIGNIAASIVIRSFGCATTSIEEIQQSLNKMNMDNYTIKV